VLKQIFVFLLTVSFLIPMSSVSANDINNLSAKSAIVMEASTGKILFAKDAETRRYPASTTKMMTLIVALEHGNLNEIVTTSPNAASVEGSSLWLAAGEQLKLEDMLYGIMLVSGNDATVAVAEHISGSLEKFAKLMTEKAHAIGATHTNFTNSSGLPDPQHYSTAHDLGKIAAYGYKNPLFTKIVGTKYKVIPWPGKDHDRELYNENKILWRYEGGNGVKTGYTEAAGRCLVAGAKRNGVQLVTVVLDSDYMWEDTMALLDYGFRQIKPMKLFNQGDILKTVRINDGKAEFVKLVTSGDITIAVSEDDKDQFDTIINAPATVEAPILEGQKMGTVKVMYKNTEVSSVDLLASEAVERKSFFRTVWGSLWSFFTFVIRNFA
jgi:D-alanyl-D-alanine carboxypeptidase (penicillin-binding protein 5/6)